jgi:hypothetical protein
MKALQISRHVNHKDTFVQVKGLLLISAVFVHSSRSGQIPAADIRWKIAFNTPTL